MVGLLNMDNGNAAGNGGPQNPNNTLKDLLDISTMSASQFRCNVCHANFKGRHQLNQHRSTHKDGPCTICGTMITSQENFLDHLAAYHPEKMVYKPRDRSGAEKIKKVSTREQKPHRCGKCQKRFATPTELQEHERKHPRRKQNQCEICEHMCATAHDLKIHMRVHTNEKPFKCEVEHCYKDFRSKGALFTHLRSSHGADPFKCRKCGASFKMARPMKAHEKECGV